MMGIETGGGGSARDVATRRDFVGRDSSDHRNNVNVYLTDDDWLANESERRQWMVRQISELRYALLGDDKFGVSGMVDAVHNQRIWLIVLTALVVLVIFILIWQGVQIHQILQRLG